jgi:hypothetical protein
VQVAIDPLLPGLTDTHDNLSAVLKAVAATGVRHVTASYLFLREGIARELEATLQPHGLHKTVLDNFADAPVLTAPRVTPARYLPRGRRQRGYGQLIALAAAHGITVSLCGQSNPDFGPPRPPTAPVDRPRLVSLTVNGK